MRGDEWATIQTIMNEVCKVSKEKKLFADREEFEEYWTKRKVALILKGLGIKQKYLKINGKCVRAYLL